MSTMIVGSTSTLGNDLFYYIFFYYFIYITEASRGPTAQGVTVKPTVLCCGFDPHSRRLNIYLNLYFHFSGVHCSGVEAKRGVEFCHSTCNTSIIL